jgi:DNA-binding HxlR family transcriptional regulator
MSLHAQRVGTAAITENLLKRKWSVIILRCLEKGFNDPAVIIAREPDLSPHVLSERLRTMVRYGVVARYPQPSPSSITEYRLTAFGKRIVELLSLINALDRQFVFRSGTIVEAQSSEARDRIAGEAKPKSENPLNSTASYIRSDQLMP